MKAVAKLVPGTIPLPVVRATVLGEVMKNYGLPNSIIEIAQNGLTAGDFSGIIFRGHSPSGALREQSHLSFDVLKPNEKVSLKLVEGQSMTEALSKKLAHAIAASIGLMQKQRLKIHYTFCVADGRPLSTIIQKYGLDPPSDNFGDAPVPPLRKLFEVSPGRVPCIRFAHYTTG